MSAALTGYCLFALFPSIRAGNLNLSIWSGGIVVTCFTFAWLVFKFIILRSAHPDLTSGIKISMVFLMFPLAMLAAGSLSTGGTFFSLYEPIGFFVLLLPLLFSHKLALPLRVAYCAVVGMAALSGVFQKIQDPASWLMFNTPPLFSDRKWVENRAYGPMFLSGRLSVFFGQVCSIIGKGPQPPTLLSIPFSFANYYCAIPPWQNYVQTWYDTASPAVIERMELQLNTSPPEWVLYQRQLAVLRLHEKAFNSGKPLSQRFLDRLIMSRIRSGRWRLALYAHFGTPGLRSDWYLIRTDPAVSQSPKRDNTQGFSLKPPLAKRVPLLQAHS